MAEGFKPMARLRLSLFIFNISLRLTPVSDGLFSLQAEVRLFGTKTQDLHANVLYFLALIACT